MKEKIAMRSEVLPADVERVWYVVTNNADSRWRTDVMELQRVSDTEWIEYYTPDSYTRFTILEKRENELYVFEMKNKRFTGVWTGMFSREANGTRLAAEERIRVKNPILRLLFPLKKMMRSYFEDLKRKLSE